MVCDQERTGKKNTVKIKNKIVKSTFRKKSVFCFRDRIFQSTDTEALHLSIFMVGYCWV